MKAKMMQMTADHDAKRQGYKADKKMLYRVEILYSIESCLTFFYPLAYKVVDAAVAKIPDDAEAW